MPDLTPSPDYSTHSKAQLLDELLRRDITIAELEAAITNHIRSIQRFNDEREQEQAVRQAQAEEREIARAARGPAKLLGKIEVFDTDAPEDVLARATEIRAGRVPLSVAKRFRTIAHLRAPAGSKLAQRLAPAAKEGTRPNVPLGTQFDLDEMPRAQIEHFHEAAAIAAIG